MKKIKKWTREEADDRYRSKAIEILAYDGEIDFAYLSSKKRDPQWRLIPHIALEIYRTGLYANPWSTSELFETVKEARESIDSDKITRRIKDLEQAHFMARKKAFSQTHKLLSEILPESLSEENLESLLENESSNFAEVKRVLGTPRQIVSQLHDEYKKTAESDTGQKKILEYEEKLRKKCHTLLRRVGIVDKEKVKIVSNDQINYDLLEKTLELAGWLYFKYPLDKQTIYGVRRIKIPKSLVISEKLVPKNEMDKDHFEVHEVYDHDCDDHFHC